MAALGSLLLTLLLLVLVLSQDLKRKWRKERLKKLWLSSDVSSGALSDNASNLRSRNQDFFKPSRPLYGNSSEPKNVQWKSLRNDQLDFAESLLKRKVSSASNSRKAVTLICQITSGPHYNPSQATEATTLRSRDPTTTVPVQSTFQPNETVTLQSFDSVTFLSSDPITFVSSDTNTSYAEPINSQTPLETATFPSSETSTLPLSEATTEESTNSVIFPSTESIDFQSSEPTISPTQEALTSSPTYTLTCHLARPDTKPARFKPSVGAAGNFQPRLRLRSKPSLAKFQPSDDIALEPDSSQQQTRLDSQSKLAKFQPTDDDALEHDSSQQQVRLDSQAKLATSQPSEDAAALPEPESFQPRARVNLKSKFAQFHPSDDVVSWADPVSFQPRSATPPDEEIPTPRCDYLKFHPRHSMLLENNTKCNIQKRGVSLQEKKQILMLHNTHRAKVARGDEQLGNPGPQPPAANMGVLVWNDELAEVAQAWANQCRLSYDGFDERRICSRKYIVGQNLYFKLAGNLSASWPEVIHHWYLEVANLPSTFVDSFRVNSSTKKFTSYTKMIWGETREVGCGAVYYLQREVQVSHLYVCNYGPSGNTIGDPIYEVGPPATACSSGVPSTTYKGLCDVSTSH
ncbi:uncharacterized protein [Cherax quadricarinatus]|uniref:uncharacterized protein isoform X2 n=1 Tax=Cherax quadricarinatus TaxID=27406 RepID=UPI002379431C|nr:uncharacterized protein LOC128701871 isoform X2 [Cherax quadricarinatus]